MESTNTRLGNKMTTCRILLLFTPFWCCAAQSQPASVYVATNRGNYRSLDGGDTWSRLRTEFAEPGAYGLAADPSDQNVLYAATDQGVYRSSDGGETWLSTGFLDAASSILVDASSSPSRLYATGFGPASAIWLSTDAGASWARIFEPTRQGLMRIAVDSANPSTAYVATPGGLFKSQDNGRTWSEIGTGISSSWLAVDGGRLVRMGDGGLWTSSDAAETWTQ